MGFRDDREASVQRIDVLERDLAATKNELEAATLRAVEVEDLRKNMVVLRTERDALKAGIEPVWAARHQRTLMVSTALVIVCLFVAGGTIYVGMRESTRQAQRQARAEADLSQCEYQGEPLRQQRDAAREELRQIDDVHAGELRSLQQQLTVARAQEAGPHVLVLAHVESRTGNVPDGTDDTCVMAIHDLTLGYCSAVVMCGSAQVFPRVLPPDVVCRASRGGRWTVESGVPLGHAVARSSTSVPPLLEYDAGAHTLDVRETGAGPFTLRMRVTDVVPFDVR